MSVINLQNIRQAEGLMDSLHDVRTKIEPSACLIFCKLITLIAYSFMFTPK